MPRLLAPALLALAACLATWPALDGSFVYDDLPYVRDNPVVHGDAPLWTSPLGTPDQGLWRPFTVWTWRLQWSPPYDAGPFRVANVLLHAAVTLLVWLLGRRLGLGSTAAWLGGLLFAVHPVHAESVAWITGRAELLATFWVLAGWWLHRGGGGARAFWGSAACVALAGLSKENALVAPGLYLLADLALPAARTGARRVPWERLALLGAVSLAVFGARLAALESPLPAHGPFHDTGLAGRVVVALAVLGRALGLLVWPHPLRIHYQGIEFETLAAPALVAVGLLALCLVLLWTRQRPVALCLALVPASLAPVLHLLPIGEPFAERFLYLPSVGVCLAAGGLLAAWGRRELDGRGLGPSVATGAALVALALPASRSAVAVFHDDLSLWSRAHAVAPELAMVRYNHATFLVDAERHLTVDRHLPGAADELAASLELAPGHVHAGWAHQSLGHYAMGALGGGMPDPVTAARHYRRAIELLPGLVDARINLASLTLASPDVVDPAEARGLLRPLLEARDVDPGKQRSAQQLLANIDELLARTASDGPG